MKIKKILSTICILGVIAITPYVSFALEENIPSEVTRNENEILDISDHKVYHSKENVSISEKWSDNHRVSDNLNGIAGDTITSNKGITFSTSVSGDITGLNISVSGEITSDVGYTMQLPTNGNYHMEYRVKYRIERGTRVSKTVTGAILGRNEYVVKSPLYGEFSLVRN